METEVARIIPYIFFYASLALVGASALRIYQRNLYFYGIIIRNKQMEKQQKAASNAFFQKKSLVDRKQEIVDSLVKDISSVQRTANNSVEEDGLRRELTELRKRFDSHSKQAEHQRSEADRETEDLLAAHRLLYRRAILAEVALLALSLVAAAGVALVAGQNLT